MSLVQAVQHLERFEPLERMELEGLLLDRGMNVSLLKELDDSGFIDWLYQ